MSDSTLNRTSTKVWGGIVALVGVLLFVFRVPLAVSALGAHAIGGMPVLAHDFAKVGMVNLTALGFLGLGLLVVVASVVASVTNARKTR